jgi:hypothetical protein
MESIAEKEVERIYESLMENIEGGMLYGKRIAEFSNQEQARVVAAYYTGMFPNQGDVTQYHKPIPIWELGGKI